MLQHGVWEIIRTPAPLLKSGEMGGNKMKEFSKEEIEKFDGEDGRTALVVVNGKVYDVSSSRLWNKGHHMQQHSAGGDLTDEFTKMAPHGEEVFEKVEQVGVIRESGQESGESKSGNNWADWILGFHPHPITVHFPQAFLVFAPLFLLLFYVTGNQHFERTAFYMLVCGTITLVPSIFTGLFHWVYKYAKSDRRIFKFKIVVAIALLFVAGIALGMHSSAGMLVQNPINYIVIVFYLLLIPLVISLGYAGGIIVFGGRK